MQNLTWPPAAKIADHEVTIQAHSRGAATRGGHYFFERGPGARWRARLEVPAMRTSDALTFRAFLHALRGRAGTFLLALPRPPASSNRTPRPDGKTQFTDGTDWTDGTAFSDQWTFDLQFATYQLTADAAAGADTITLPAAAATGYTTAVGTFLTVGYPGTDGQLLRLVSIGTPVGDNVALTIRPRLRVGRPAGTAVMIGRVEGRWRLADETPAVPLLGDRSRPVELEIVEAY
jgi:hypothetical protein